MAVFPHFQIERLLPYQSRYVEIAGYRMHYLDEGEGPVVLCLHGNPTWCFYFRNLIAALEPNYRVIVPDYIGCGLSDHPENAHFRAAHRIEHLVEFTRKLGLERFSLVMHDWGGPIGTGLAVRMPNAIEKIVYLNTTLTETESLPAVIKTSAMPFVGRFLTRSTMRFLKLTTDFGVVRKLPKEIKEGYYYPYRTSARRTAIWDFVADIPFDSSHPSYAEMLDMADKIPLLSHVPVQIIWGLKDLCFHREMLTKVALHFPQADVLEIPKASHLVLEDAPELVHSTIKSFLSRQFPAHWKPGSPGVNETANPLYASFREMAQAIPQKDAAIVPTFIGDTVRYAHTTFRDLDILVNKYQRGLTELGLTAGDKVIMLVKPGADFLALSYAVMARGAVPVFVDPGVGKHNLMRCIAETKPQVFIGSPKAQLIRLLKPALFKGLKFHVTACDWLAFAGPNLAFLKKFAPAALPAVPASPTALVAFTSGATGVPKGVVFTQEMARAQLSIFRDEFGLEAGTKDLPLLPIFSLFNVANGVCSVFPPVDPSKPLSLKPHRILKIINDLSVQFSFGSPTLWNKIAEYCKRSHSNLSSIRRIFMAGAPVPAPVLQRVQQVIQDGEAFTPYGSTEALPVTLISANQILDGDAVSAVGGETGTPVGRCVKCVEMRVIAPKDEPIASIEETTALSAGEIGEIIVKGANVSPFYEHRPEATRSAKIKDGEQFWHRMGDMGYLDGAGNLYFCGRKAHLVKVGERTYYSIPTERIFNHHPKVKRSALISVNNGAEPAIVIEPHPQYWPENTQSRMDFEQELKAIAAASPLTESIQKIFFHSSFPVDARHNAKIFRDKLAVWAEDLLKAEHSRQACQPS